jgi:ClpP class serine protease
VGLKMNFREFFKQKLGVTFGTYENDEGSKLFSSLESNGEKQHEGWNTFMEKFYKSFVSKVSKARNMSEEEVEKIAQGKIHTGSNALKNGLIDKLGDFDDAVEEMKNLLNIKNQKVQLVYYPKKKEILDYLQNDEQSNSIDQDKSPDNISTQTFSNISSSFSLFSFFNNILNPYTKYFKFFSKTISNNVIDYSLISNHDDL